MKILIAGGTGLVGGRLSPMLRDKGHDVSHLSRRRNLKAEFPAYEWNVYKGYIEAEALEGVDSVINLAGVGIADKRWTEKRKKHILDSRTQSAGTIGRYIVEEEFRPQSYLSASAIGFYGNRGDEWLTETSRRGEGFLADTTVAWEKTVANMSRLVPRTVTLRIGIVLAAESGALPRMMLPFKAGVGQWFGDGSQYQSWIHIDDLCGMFLKAVEDERMRGIYNAVAPHPVTNKELMRAIKTAKGSSALMMGAPTFALRLALGEMADVVLQGNRVSAEKIVEAGFGFEFPKVEDALENLLGA